MIYRIKYNKHFEIQIWKHELHLFLLKIILLLFTNFKFMCTVFITLPSLISIKQFSINSGALLNVTWQTFSVPCFYSWVKLQAGWKAVGVRKQGVVGLTLCPCYLWGCSVGTTETLVNQTKELWRQRFLSCLVPQPFNPEEIHRGPLY